MLLTAWASCGSPGISGPGKDSAGPALPVQTAQPGERIRAAPSARGIEFVQMAAGSSLMAMDLGRLAKQKSGNRRIRGLGSQILREQTALSGRLRIKASDLGIELPSTEDLRGRRQISALERDSGRAFDKKFLQVLFEDHRRDLAQFRKAADNLNDSALKVFAGTGMMILEEELDSIRSVSGKK
jgi:putative membrane protein